VDVGSSAVTAGLIALAMALVKLTEYAIRRKNGSNNAGIQSGIERLIDICRGQSDTGREQLSLLRSIDREMAAIRSDMRAASIEQAHLQRTVDALHRRQDEWTKDA
jgi:chromosome segregation ATPase